MPRTLRVFDDLDALSDAALVELSRLSARSVGERGRFTLLLSGGNTPRALYARLAQHPELPWAQTELWFGDERAVPVDHPASNAGMVRAVLSAKPFIPLANVQRIRGELSPAEAAADYEQRLRSRFASEGVLSGSSGSRAALTPPCFDLVLLGLGGDGHTASLFPHAPALHEKHAWVTTHAPPPAPARITLTYPVLNNARAVLFLVAGADKAEALRRVFDEHGSSDDVPARGIAPAQGTLAFFTDRAAASALPGGSPLPSQEG